MSKTVLGYWSLRGRSLPIRLMLAYSGEEYEDKVYVIPPAAFAADASMEAFGRARIEAEAKQEGVWFDEKYKLGLDFPNLPYLFIDGHKIAQTSAIWRYLARKHSLDGVDDAGKVAVDTLNGVYDDIRGAIRAVAYSGKGEAAEKQKQMLFKVTLPKWFKQLSDYLGKRDYFVGDSLTLADFLLFDLLDTLVRIDDAYVKEKAPVLHEFVTRFRQLSFTAKALDENPTWFWPAFPAFASIGH